MTRGLLRLLVTGCFVSAVAVASGVLPAWSIVDVWAFGAVASVGRRNLIDRGEL